MAKCAMCRIRKAEYKLRLTLVPICEHCLELCMLESGCKNLCADDCPKEVQSDVSTSD